MPVQAVIERELFQVSFEALRVYVALVLVLLVAVAGGDQLPGPPRLRFAYTNSELATQYEYDQFGKGNKWLATHTREREEEKQ